VPSVTAAQLKTAKKLVSVGGTATRADADAVATKLAILPTAALRAIDKARFPNGAPIKIIATKGSITDYVPELRGVRPRGWPPGTSWDSVPGISLGSTVVIATRDGRVPEIGNGHGSYDLVVHETFHSVDSAGGPLSQSADFLAAYNADKEALGSYYRQEEDAGRAEAFAETAARYFGHDPTLEKENPNLYRYFDTHRDLFAEGAKKKGRST
jgi:hypothetical protein